MSERPTDPARTTPLGTLERHEVRYVVIAGAAAEAPGW